MEGDGVGASELVGNGLGASVIFLGAEMTVHLGLNVLVGATEGATEEGTREGTRVGVRDVWWSISGVVVELAAPRKDAGSSL